MEHKPKILIVDDDPNLRKTLTDILRVKGYDTIAAGSGAEAIAAVQGGRLNVSLIDLRLPDMSGLDVMGKIKEQSPLTEAIILTGHASLDTAIEATRRGAFSYLLKPYQMEELLLNIQHGVERQQAQEEIQRLASYPRLNPDPVIEMASTGEVTYVNPAAGQQFPDIGELGNSHPLLAGVDQLFETLRQDSRHELSRELWIEDAAYEQHISYIPESDLIRIYVLDITRRKKAESELENREREQAAVATLGTQALTGLDLAAVYEKAIALIKKTLGVEYCMILELQQGKDKLLFRAGSGWDAGLYGSALIEVSEGNWADAILRSEEPVCFKDSKEIQVPFPPLLEQYGIVSGITAPIGPVANPLGILGVFTTVRREFADDDGRFLQAIANVIATAQDRLHAEEEIHALASTDSLTGIANRRVITVMLEKEMDRARRYGSALSLIMYDIDHFKLVNDTFGHEVGDEVLKTMTILVSNNIRAADFPARWGGEEFLILAPESNLEAARGEAERLREVIAAYPFEKVGKVTVSFGVASYYPTDDMKSFLKRVDDALYLAKERGRNRVEELSLESSTHETG